MSRPFMVLTGSLDGDPFGTYAGGETRWRVFEGLPSGAKAGLWLDGADHTTFAGVDTQRAEAPRRVRDAGALAAPPRHPALIASLTTQWWRWRLQDDAAAARALTRVDGLGADDRWALS